ncbi:S-adenosylmethionine:tRNA ribosyltransferase-isomerase [Labilibacter sediminis]|nr:S-adenosylmethionine:tRNA ribosyltransferase-isomerase [Labilibacter sediminis]
MNIPQIYIKDYTYNLPDDRIAKYPLDNRSDSKLLIYDKEIQESNFSEIPNILPSNSLVIFNNTKVIQARLQFQKETGAKIEIFCLEPIEPRDTSIAFQVTKETTWKCIVGNSKKWKDGALSKSIIINNKTITLKIHRIETFEDSQAIKFTWDDDQISFGELLEGIGNTPIPPYLNRKSEESDTERYQTVYSTHKGSVAAPTAGLHFTPEILSELKHKNIETANVTLHVGAGTFKPVKSEAIDSHEMHIEHFFVDMETIDLILKYEGNITSTGTTTVRTLESLYWLGVKLLEENNEFFINQWDPYNLPQHHSLKDALNKLKSFLISKNKTKLESYTGVLIAPGYEFRIVNRLITNFHQPNSTLLLLISAFTKGEKWKEIYDYALKNDFRFLSYGDSSLLYKG